MHNTDEPPTTVTAVADQSEATAAAAAAVSDDGASPWCLLLCTHPDAEAAKVLARQLVAEKLVACMNVLPQGLSIYRWQGEIEESAEVLLLMKTRAAYFDELCARIHDLHPYEVPEVIAVPITQLDDAYAQWLHSVLPAHRALAHFPPVSSQ